MSYSIFARVEASIDPEDVVVDPAAELGPHRALARGGAEDDVDRLLNVAVAGAQRKPSEPVDSKWKRNSGANDVGHLPLPGFGQPRLSLLTQTDLGA